MDNIEVEIHRKWIRSIRLKVCSPNGNIVLSAPVLMTNQEIMNFLSSRLDWMRKNQEKVIRRATQSQNIPTLYSPEEFSAIVTQLMEKYCILYGEENVSWRLRKMKSRWGSCMPQKRIITINTELAKHPQQCIEYVIIHEFCHLQVPNHSADFKALMTKRLPNWKILKKQLNNG